mmetsp:Transcript_6417/g.13008  ORF Transcript_6417/g.13008 Transcript_6417/m.13008 type:complete len:286 (-) Transcript_6417:489-1346(-)|eukprot:CAMPEP_0171496730 /NCGR_PEP_ID=MMETSP0958-20121227/6869_1 /TAXON_ID=87120 /ORGANISM="Aurantiochytrium limacinum, Strain ATCCMYA-1381" /LENGTH=285 /DNA_ID=CAMNT_0012030875 /DNA_START=853 /DNA_END=1710 /DNA_ORIENTATION=+
MVLKAGRGRLSRNGGKADRFMKFHLDTDFHGPSDTWIARQGAVFAHAGGAGTGASRQAGPAGQEPRLQKSDKANSSAMVWASLVREAQAASENAKQGMMDLSRVSLDDPCHWPALSSSAHSVLSSDDDEPSLGTSTSSMVFETQMEGDLKDKHEWICLSNKRYVEALQDEDEPNTLAAACRHVLHRSSASISSAASVGTASICSTNLTFDTAFYEDDGAIFSSKSSSSAAADPYAEGNEWLVVDLCTESGVETFSSSSEASLLVEEEEVAEDDMLSEPSEHMLAL